MHRDVIVLEVKGTSTGAHAVDEHQRKYSAVVAVALAGYVTRAIWDQKAPLLQHQHACCLAAHLGQAQGGNTHRGWAGGGGCAYML